MHGSDPFRAIAPFYDRFAGPTDPGPVLELLQLSHGDRILDVGGGTGRVAQALRGLSYDVAVIDRSLAMLRRARDKGLPALQGMAERLPYGDGSFARILAVDCMHHFGDQPLAAREMLRVLGPGGRVVLEEPNLEERSVKVMAFLERLLLMGSHLLTSSELQQLFEAAGGRTFLERHGMSLWAVVDKPEVQATGNSASRAS